MVVLKVSLCGIMHGLQVRSDAGTLAKVEVDVAKQTVTVYFDEVGAQPLSEFRFRVLCRSEKLCTAGADTYKPAGLAKTRGGFVVKPTVGVAGVAISAAR